MTTKNVTVTVGELRERLERIDDDVTVVLTVKDVSEDMNDYIIMQYFMESIRYFADNGLTVE